MEDRSKENLGFPKVQRETVAPRPTIFTSQWPLPRRPRDARGYKAVAETEATNVLGQAKQ